MPDGQDNISLTALCIGLIALIISTGQLAQQLFATAEGFRRCSSSVLGPWAKKTRLKWRWSQFRFEVKFTTPDIVLETSLPKRQKKVIRNAILRPPAVPVDATGDSAGTSQVQVYSGADTDLVGWVKLLEQLEELQDATDKEIPYKTEKAGYASPVLSAAMSLREWSWDLMPPEVVRPMATITTGTLVVLAHRLGMVWRDLQPSEDIFRAEGNGQSISSTALRGLGILVQYTCDESIFRENLSKGISLRIPTAAADKMSCGIIPGIPKFGLPDLPMQLNEPTGKSELDATASVLHGAGINLDVVRGITVPGDLNGMHDLFLMYTPFLPLRGSKIIEVFSPLRTAFKGCLGAREGRIILQARLRQYLREEQYPSKHLVGLSEDLDRFARKHEFAFVNTFGYHPDRHYYDELARTVDDAHDLWDKTTAFLQILQEAQNLRLIDLISAHLACSLKSWKQAKQNFADGTHRDDQSLVKGARASDWVEVCHCYADNINEVVDSMAQSGFHDKALVKDAWWTLIVRALYFAAPLVLLPETTFTAVSSRFYGSRTPVYVA